MTDVITFGETLVVGQAHPPGPLRHATTLHLDIAGAESNVAIGLRRLGHTVAWVGRVGADEFGSRVLGTLRAEDIDTSCAVVDPDAPTAFMTTETRTTTATRVAYYRTGSAGSRLCPADVPTIALTQARILHLTGVTAALSSTARTALHAAIDTARAAGVLVSLDINYRSRLWPDRTQAAHTLAGLTRRADLVFASDNEHDLIDGEPGQIVITRGTAGATALVEGHAYDQDAFPVTAVEPIGAGDAFVAGYLSALLDGADPATRLRRGAILGAFAAASHSDWQGLPTRAELHLIGTDDGTTIR
jgi:2-dehydro-3-deoxygluconokinase